MSYEGYEIYLCARGHENVQDALVGYFGEESSTCEYCKAPLVWRCGVDQTNDSGVAPKLIEHVAAKTATCECCGVTRMVDETRFCIPSNAGHRLHKNADGEEIHVEVPFARVQFEDLDSGELFDTPDEAWENKGYR